MDETGTTGAGTGQQRGLMERVRGQAATQLASQKDRATDGLGNIAQAIRQSSRPFRDRHQDTIAEYVETAADQLDRLSTRLRERDLGELVDEAQRFARRQPALFIGGAFALGLMTARFLKSSAERHTDVGARPDWRRYGERGYSRGGV